MENASKALLIAGGVLISVIVISLIVVLYTNISSFSNNKQQILEANELTKYNAEWESYNRDDLKGTDIITIINKVISINEKYRAQMDNPELVMTTVWVETTKQFGETIVEYTWNEHMERYVKLSTTSNRLLAIKNYKIIGDDDSDGDIIRFVNKLKSTSKSETIITGNAKTEKHPNYKEITNEFDSFKLEDFKCTGIKYNNNGQVKEISFKQK